MRFEEIEFASDEYYHECELRNLELRRPLGLDLWTEDLALERAQRHFGLFSDDRKLLACVVAVPLPEGMKIRQMAVAASQQGRGLGRQLIEQMETGLAREGVRHFTMHARITAVGFYEKLGYRPTGDEFLEVSIPHVRMEKTLIS